MIYALLIVLMYLFMKYGEPVLNMYLDVFAHAQACKSNEYKIKMQIDECELFREYPELNEHEEQMPAIGFHNDEDKFDYYVDEQDIEWDDDGEDLDDGNNEEKSKLDSFKRYELDCMRKNKIGF
jgi:hypothetical protein